MVMLMIFPILFSSSATDGNDNMTEQLLNSTTTSDYQLGHGQEQTSLFSQQQQLASNLTQATMALNQQDSYTLPCFKDLYAVLFECFSIITLGYLSCRFKLISPEAKDLGSYLTTFALPMIIFLNIAQMEFKTINLSFLFCMLISKLSLFILVTLLTLATSYPTNFSYAGALSILATQSNDFALGYPLIKSLYGETKPEMLNYLSLMAPIQLLILNPMGIIMLEYEKTRRKKRGGCKFGSCSRASGSSLVIGGGASCNKCGSQPVGDESFGDYRDETSTKKRCNDTDNNNNSDQQHLRDQHHHCLKAAPMNHDQSRPKAMDVSTHQQPSDNPLTDDFMLRDSSITSRMVLSPASQKGKNRLSLILPARTIDLECCSSTSIESFECNDDVADLDPQTLDANTIGIVTKSGETGRTAEPPNGKLSNNSPKSDLSRVVFELPIGHHQINPLVRQSQNSTPVQQESMSTSDCSEGAGRRPSACSCRSFTQGGQSVISWSFLKALLTNPLIIASVVALVVNLTNGPQLPKLLTKVSNTIAASFAAPALFVVGLSMYGKFELLLRSPNDLLLSSVLVITKVILLPSFMRTITLLILPAYVSAEDVPYLTDFSYLYGLLPTAPTACIIAKQYGVLTNVVSISMLLSTFISAPLMLATSAIISQSFVINVSTIQGLILQTLRASSVITLTLSLITLCSLCRTNRLLNYVNFTNLPEITRQAAKRIKSNSTHLFSFLLVLSQLLIGIGGSFWLMINKNDLDLVFSKQAAMPTSRFELIRSMNAMANGTFMDTSNFASESELNLTTLGDLMAEPETDPIHEETEVHEILISTPKAHTPEFKMLCVVQSIFSTSGLLMARLVVASIVVLTVGQLLKGSRMAARLSSILTKLLLFVGTGTLILAIFECKHLKCLPTESSMPTWSVSLYLRLAYNATLLIVSIPLLSIMFRAGNKASWLRQINGLDENGKLILDKRPFLTSSASLSSETSSAVTSNTNLDSIPSPVINLANQSIVDIKPNRIRNVDSDRSPVKSKNSSDSTASVINCNEFEAIASQQHNLQHNQYNNQARTSSRTHHSTPTNFINNNNISTHNNDNFYVNSNRPGDDEIVETRCAFNGNIPPSRPYPTEEATAMDSSGFNRYSVIIVFMIVQVVLNFTTIIQILSQDKPYGTFRQIEIASVALDFGQGLLTFLVLGSSWFPRKLISLGTSCKSVVMSVNQPSIFRRDC